MCRVCDACVVVCMGWEYDERVTAMLSWGLGTRGCCEYIGGTRDAGIVSSVDGVLEMSVVR